MLCQCVHADDAQQALDSFQPTPRFPEMHPSVPQTAEFPVPFETSRQFTIHTQQPDWVSSLRRSTGRTRFHRNWPSQDQTHPQTPHTTTPRGTPPFPLPVHRRTLDPNLGPSLRKQLVQTSYNFNFEAIRVSESVFQLEWNNITEDLAKEEEKYCVKVVRKSPSGDEISEELHLVSENKLILHNIQPCLYYSATLSLTNNPRILPETIVFPKHPSKLYIHTTFCKEIDERSPFLQYTSCMCLT